VPNFAALDCGSLSTRLLVSASDGTTLARLMRITRLGQGVDARGALEPEAMDRALAVLRQYRTVMDSHDVVGARMVGTSALRDASNREDFCGPAGAVVGVPLELLSGGEEAALSLAGATAAVPAGTGPWLMADIGGGSTELAVGDGGGGAALGAVSLDVGCVRLTERFMHHDPPQPGELVRARAWLATALARAEEQVPALRAGRALIGLAGTVSALACVDQGLATYQRELVHHYRLRRGAVDDALARLASLPMAQRAGLPGIEAARAPVIVGGAQVLSSVMAHFDCEECLVSESDILDGLVSSLLQAHLRRL
jgi:exopolyphosphatase / guanosine-5'-triphosphate,3'-diphosphate pyrophosphatase